MEKTVSVPLRGLDMRKRKKRRVKTLLLDRFSPLAGIRYAETHDHTFVFAWIQYIIVSVPLRGLDIQKPKLHILGISPRLVEVFQSPCGD